MPAAASCCCDTGKSWLGLESHSEPAAAPLVPQSLLPRQLPRLSASRPASPRVLGSGPLLPRCPLPGTRASAWGSHWPAPSPASHLCSDACSPRRSCPAMLRMIAHPASTAPPPPPGTFPGALPPAGALPVLLVSFSPKNVTAHSGNRQAGRRWVSGSLSYSCCQNVPSTRQWRNGVTLPQKKGGDGGPSRCGGGLVPRSAVRAPTLQRPGCLAPPERAHARTGRSGRRTGNHPTPQVSHSDRSLCTLRLDPASGKQPPGNGRAERGAGSSEAGALWG